MVTRVSAIDVDLLDPAFYADLDGVHEVFRRWRADDPVHRDEHHGLWAVTRHAEQRSIVARKLTIKAVTRQEAWIRSTVGECSSWVRRPRTNG